MKNLMLKELLSELNKINAKYKEEVKSLKDSIKQTFELDMAAKEEALTALVSELSQSKELTNMPTDQFAYRWLRVNFAIFIDTNDYNEQKLLEQYMYVNYQIKCDFEHNVVLKRECPCIVITDSGDIYDESTQKWVGEKKDYKTEDERNKVIEAYMAKTKNFLSVVKYGREGVEGFIEIGKKVIK